MKGEYRSSQLLLYSSYACLVTGLFRVVCQVVPLGEKENLFTGLILMFCMEMWMFHILEKQVKIPVLMMIPGICLAAVLVKVQLLPIAPTAGCFLAALFGYIIMIRMKKGKWIFWSVLLFFLIRQLQGYSTDQLGILLLLFSFLGNRIYTMVFFEKEDQNRVSAVRILIAERGIVLAGLAAIVSLWAADSLLAEHGEMFLMAPVILQEHILRRFFINEWKTGHGEINRGNHLPVGEKQLRIILEKKPEETIYLKDYTAGDYLGNRWEEADENSYYEGLRRLQSENSWRYYHSPGQFENRQFSELRYGKWEIWVQENGSGWDVDIAEKYQEWSGQQKMEVYRLTDERERMVPYFAESSVGLFGEYSVILWYPQREYMEYLKQGKPPETGKLFEWMEEPYKEYVQGTYLQVPEERLPRLKELVLENPMESPEKITDFIRKTLYTRASYSLTPGLMPSSREISEYFLFESGKGYCQHFATTATLLYRLYGIPARYVTGYAAGPDSFEEQENGSYLAEVTDAQAHAWVEIYLDGAGWLPMEMTPTAVLAGEEGEIVDSVRSIENSVIEESGILIQEEKQTEFISDQKEAQQNGSMNSESTVPDNERKLLLNPFLAGTALVVMAAGSAIWFVTRIRRRKETVGSVENLYRRAEGIYRRANSLSESRDFGEKALEELRHLALKEAFGRHGLSELESREAEKWFEELLEAVGRRGKWIWKNTGNRHMRFWIR